MRFSEGKIKTFYVVVCLKKETTTCGGVDKSVDSLGTKKAVTLEVNTTSFGLALPPFAFKRTGMEGPAF